MKISSFNNCNLKKIILRLKFEVTSNVIFGSVNILHLNTVKHKPISQKQMNDNV